MFDQIWNFFANLWSNLGEKVIISMVSSGFTVFLITVVKSFWESKIYPWYLKIARQNDQDIAGTWRATYALDTGHDAVDVLTIKQYGHILEGSCTYTMTHKDTNKVEERNFVLKGILKNDNAAFYYTNKKRTETGIGSMTLKVSNNGDLLRGHGVFYDSIGNALDPQDYEYTRFKS